MNYIVEFIKSSHVEVPNRPEPYGTFHLIFCALSIIIIVATCYLMRKSSDKTFRIVMFSLGTLLIASEAYKQLYYYFAAGGEGYDWYIFPFQLCSVPMYLSAVVGLMKKSRVRDAICEYLATIGFLGGFMAYAEPSGILNAHYFTLIHSCLWHAILIFMGLYIIFTGNACRSFKDYRKSLIVLGGVVFTATALNIIFRNKPDFNMCYISPFDNTPLAVFKEFDIFFEGLVGMLPGRIVSVCIYVLAIALGGLIIHSAAFGIKQLINKARPIKV